MPVTRFETGLQKDSPNPKNQTLIAVSNRHNRYNRYDARLNLDADAIEIHLVEELIDVVV